MVGGMHTARLTSNHGWQFVGVGAFQLRQTTVINDDLRQLKAVFRQLHQHFFRGGWCAFRGFLDHWQFELLEQDFTQLLR